MFKTTFVMAPITIHMKENPQFHTGGGDTNNMPMNIIKHVHMEVGQVEIKLDATNKGKHALEIGG